MLNKPIIKRNDPYKDVNETITLVQFKTIYNVPPPLSISLPLSFLVFFNNKTHTSVNKK